MPNTERIRRLVEENIDSFELNLQGTTVYTEAATGHFAVTAPIAAAAGADHVYAIANDSQYGSKEDAFEATRTIGKALGKGDAITFVNKKRPDEIEEADIVTNTGFVRPIDVETVSWMSPRTAVPLMYEPWEFRPDDVDPGACSRACVPVVGTNESHELIQTFRFIGHAVKKVAYQAGIEVLGCDVVVVGGGSIAAEIIQVLEAAGTNVLSVAPVITGKRIRSRVDYRSIEEFIDSGFVSTMDAIVIAEHRIDDEIVGAGSSLTACFLERQNPGIVLVHLCGNVDVDSLEDANVSVEPSSPRPTGYMTFNAGYVGPRPIVSLHTAGLKIGSEMVRYLREGNDASEAITKATKLPYASGVPDEFTYPE